MKKSVLWIIKWMMLAGLVLVPSCKESDAVNTNLLLDVTWQLQTMEIQTPNVIQVTGTYSMIFRNDLTVAMTVDCNTCFGTYSTFDNSALFFNAPVCTEAGCGPDSMGTMFYYALTNAYAYEIVEDILRITFQNTITLTPGYLTFRKIRMQ